MLAVHQSATEKCHRRMLLSAVVSCLFLLNMGGAWAVDCGSYVEHCVLSKGYVDARGYEHAEFVAPHPTMQNGVAVEWSAVCSASVLQCMTLMLGMRTMAFHRYINWRRFVLASISSARMPVMPSVTGRAICMLHM